MIQFKYDQRIIEEVKKLPGRKWEPALKSWYLPDTKENREHFGLPLKLPSKRKLEKVNPVNQAALDKLRELLILKGYSKNTQRTYYYEFAQLLAALGNNDVNDMDYERLRSYFLYCAEKFKLTESQIQSRINAVKNQKHLLMLKLCYGMGLRVSEVVALKISDIDSGNMQVLISRGKGKKDRYVNLPKSILEELRDYYRSYKPQKYLFVWQGGGAYSVRSLQKVFKTAMEAAKINKVYGIHGLRHSYATHLLQSGADISCIQQLLGHNGIKTTLAYTRVAQKDLKKIKSPLDDL